MRLRNLWTVPRTALLAAGQVSAMSGAQKNSRGFTIGYALMQSTILTQWGQFTFATMYGLEHKKQSFQLAQVEFDLKMQDASCKHWGGQNSIFGAMEQSHMQCIVEV